MSYLRGFEEDIFISYAHVDDEPLAEGQRGWISSFHRALEIRLGQLLGDKPAVWRDETKLRGNDYFEDKIVLSMPKIGVLVSVLTPRYVKSEWCMKEIKEFYRVAQQMGGVSIEAKARIFKVIKTPVPPERHPPELQGMLGYEFYQLDPRTGNAREFILDFGSSADRNYWDKLNDLVYDIYHLLETLNNHTPGATLPPDIQVGPTVFLAETTSDLYLERDKIKRELLERGCKVVPDQPLPLHAVEFERAVRAALERSKLSIHLIGSNYGLIPEAAADSVVSLQNRLAAERSRAPEFERLIWLPPNLAVNDERQQKFVAYLQNDSTAQAGAELLETSIEELKTVIADKLRQLDRPVPGEPLIRDDVQRIYLIYDQQDAEAAAPLEEYLFNQGYEVLTPLTEGEEAQVRADHKENLLLCDAVLIYYGRAGEPWLRTKLLDLRKMAGYGRARAVRAQAIYVGLPDAPAKQRLRTHEALVLKQIGDFAPDLLQPFLTPLERAKGGRR